MTDENHNIGMHWLRKIIKHERLQQKEKCIRTITYTATVLALIYFLVRLSYINF